MFDMHRVQLDWGGRNLTLETGRIARQADGAVLATYGETSVLAAVVAAHRRGLADRGVRVELDGGTLDIDWREDGHVIMTGPAALSFEGAFDPALLAGS